MQPLFVLFVSFDQQWRYNTSVWTQPPFALFLPWSAMTTQPCHTYKTTMYFHTPNHQQCQHNTSPQIQPQIVVFLLCKPMISIQCLSINVTMCFFSILTNNPWQHLLFVLSQSWPRMITQICQINTATIVFNTTLTNYDNTMSPQPCHSYTSNTYFGTPLTNLHENTVLPV